MRHKSRLEKISACAPALLLIILSGLPALCALPLAFAAPPEPIQTLDVVEVTGSAEPPPVLRMQRVKASRRARKWRRR